MLPTRKKPLKSSIPSSQSNHVPSLFDFTTKSSDLLKQIRNTRRITTPNILPSSNSNKQKPLIIRCILPCIIVLFFIYIILFIIVDDIDMFKYLHNHTSNISIDMDHTSTIDTNILSESRNTNTMNADSYGNNYHSMLEYLHETSFNSLPHDLQTIKLHELFRYKYTNIIISRLKKGKLKIPTDYELSIELTDLYNIWDNSEVNFIQIGSCDGNWKQSNDPIQKLIITKPNWHGVMMEPVPYLYDTLVKSIEKSIVEYDHRIVPINAALSETDGTQTFYIVNEHFRIELPNESHALKYQIGSFNRDHIIKHLGIKKQRGYLKNDLDYYISGIEVKTMKPQTVINEFIKSGKSARDGTIDIISIDAEGYDYVVLKQFLSKTHIRPILIMYENLHLKEEEKKLAVKLLREHGYIEFGIGWNTLGVRTAYL